MKSLETTSDWLSMGTDIKIDEIRDYLETLNKQLILMTDDYEKKIDSQAKLITDELERDDFYAWNQDEYWNYKETFPRILLNSFHVTAYTLLESEFYSIAAKIGKKKNQIFYVTDIKGRDHMQSGCLYIKKLTNIKCTEFTSWNEIVEGQRLRNIIVHSNGKLTKDNDIKLATKHKVLSKSVKPLPSLGLDNEISISHDYAKTFLNAMSSFFTQLYQSAKAGKFL